MYSLIFITLFLLISLKLFGLTASISELHYRYFEKYKFFGYAVFPTVILTWATIVANEMPDLILAVIGIYYVGIFAMFKDKENKHIGIGHYIGALWAIIYLYYKLLVIDYKIVIVFGILSLLSLFSKFRIYLIEVLALIVLLIYYILIN